MIALFSDFPANPSIKSSGAIITIAGKLERMYRLEVGVRSPGSICFIKITPEIADGLKTAKGVKGRIEVVNTNTDYTVIIDYAHTPDGLLNILNAIKGFAKGRIVTLFGCGGDRDKTKRPQMGKIAGQLSDFCIVTSDNPRSEDPGAIIEDILVGMRETDCRYAVVENRFEAIEFAVDNAKPDDIILLAGKGHEPYQILKDRTIVFDEREIVLKLIDTSEN